MKIIPDGAKRWISRMLPGAKKEHPVPAFLRAISDAFVDDPKDGDAFVLKGLEAMKAQLELAAEAARIRDIHTRVLDGGKITLEEQTEMQQVQAQAKGVLDQIVGDPASPKDVSPEAFGQAKAAVQRMTVAYEILGWGDAPSGRWLTPIANAALSTAARGAIEAKEKHGGEFQSAMSSIMRSALGFGYSLEEPALRLAAQARRLYLQDEPAPPSIEDPRLGWRQPAGDRQTVLGELAKLSPNEVRTALTKTKLSPPMTNEEKKAIVTSSCGRVSWSASQLRTVLSDGNPYAAPSGHRILAKLDSAVALAEEYGVSLTAHEFADLPKYRAHLTVLTAGLPDPAAEGCPAPSRGDVVQSLGTLSARDFDEALPLLRIDPPLSSDETKTLAKHVMTRQLETYTTMLEGEVEKLEAHVAEIQGLIDAGETNPMAAKRGPKQSVESTLRVLAVTTKFGERHGVEPDADLAARQSTVETNVRSLLEASDAAIQAFAESIRE